MALLRASRQAVVVGFGWVGKGVAMRARGMGARVTVVEVDPIKAIEAHLDGFEVSDIMQATLKGELIITATGQKNVVPYEAIERMPQGAILANAGHSDVEVDLKTLFSNVKHISPVRPHVDEIPLHSGKKVYLVGKGRIANLVAAEGHPPEVMQMSLANQLVAATRISMIYGTMENKVYGVPDEIEQEIGGPR
jgi:adenosylhomocysteinase